MPHTTFAYPFEWKVCEFAGNLAATLAGGDRSFVMVLDEAGAVLFLTFERPASSWPEFVRGLEQADRPHLFYDPFDAPEYVWVAWHRVGRAAMERLLGQPFEDADFVRFPTASSRGPDLRPPASFPSSWGVMF
jgi:hypothetical protein